MPSRGGIMPLFLGSQLMNTLTSVPRRTEAAPGGGSGARAPLLKSGATEAESEGRKRPSCRDGAGGAGRGGAEMALGDPAQVSNP